MKIKVLLLQARHRADPARQEERRSFANRSGLEPDAVVPHDLLEGPPSLEQIRRYEALMIGGAGEFYVSHGDLPHQEATFAMLRRVVDRGPPMFASCFGFQLLVQALGGTVIHDPATTEVGTYELRLTEQGRGDPLFGGLPPVFSAQLGRKDRAVALPAGVKHLASSRACPYQALRIDGRPVWASQFHPELDREHNLARFRRYMDGYAANLSEAERLEAFDRFRESPATMDLLVRFLELVAG